MFSGLVSRNTIGLYNCSEIFFEGLWYSKAIKRWTIFESLNRKECSFVLTFWMSFVSHFFYNSRTYRLSVTPPFYQKKDSSRPDDSSPDESLQRLPEGEAQNEKRPRNLQTWYWSWDWIMNQKIDRNGTKREKEKRKHRIMYSRIFINPFFLSQNTNGFSGPQNRGPSPLTTYFRAKNQIVWKILRYLRQEDISTTASHPINSAQIWAIGCAFSVLRSSEDLTCLLFVAKSIRIF